MNPIILEWIQKARADLATAGREVEVRSSPNYDAVCFHCQQCVEKGLKALLLSKGRRPPKIHDLETLLQLVSQDFPSLEGFRDACADLSNYAVEFRYPGGEATKDIAVSAFENAQTMWQEIQKLLKC